MSTTKEILELFDKGAELKETARKSPHKLDSYLAAASLFKRAGSLSFDEAQKKKTKCDDKQEHLVFGRYYAYEEAVCLGAYYYERREPEKSIEQLKRAKEELSAAIKIIEGCQASVSARTKQRLVGFLPRWRFFAGDLDLRIMANKARSHWNNDQYIEALDIYRSMAAHERRYLDGSESDLIEPKYRRVATANYIGTMANASSALAANILAQTEVSESDGVSEVPFDLLVKLVKHTLDAYRFGNKAYDQNPEWDQYQALAKLCRQNIQLLVHDNPVIRRPLSIVFRDDPEFITILELDKAFRESEKVAIAERTRIVFLSANPTDTQQLRIDDELRAIKQKFRDAEYRDRFELFVCPAALQDDFLQALNEHRPHIVHFSGHGSDTEELVVCDENGTSKPINKDALITLFESTLSDVTVVVLNACHSILQAEAITSVIPCAIGMNDSITDPAAAVFAASFYRALAFGFSVKHAFMQGLAALKLEGLDEAEIPQLITRADVDASNLFVIQN